MRNTPTPESIYNDIERGKLKKAECVELLISLIQESEDAEIRAKYIELFKILDYKSETIFKILENCLISDENPFVRNAAAKIIIATYLKEGLNALKWTIQHEKSPLVLKTIFNSDDGINENYLQAEITKWIEDFALKLGIIPEEARFFFDLETLFTKNNENHEINENTYRFYKFLSEIQEEGPWFDLNNNHVIALNFNFFYWSYIKENMDVIPSLLRYKPLDRFFEAIKKYFFNFIDNFEIPISIGNLKYLKYLNLSHNNIQEIPEILKSLTSLERLDLNHNKIDKNSDSLKNFSKTLTELII